MLFLETQVTSYLKLRVAGGYQNIDFDNTGLVNDPNDVSDYYANLLLSHRVNSVLTHSLSAGHETQLGVNSNYTTLNYVRHTANWNILLSHAAYDGIVLRGRGGFWRESDLDSCARGLSLSILSQAEHIHRYGGALTLGYQLTPHVTLGFRYQYTQKDSDQPLRDYTQNRVSLDGTYSF